MAGRNRIISKITAWILILCVWMTVPMTARADEKETRTIRVAFPVMDGMSYFHQDGTPDGYNYAYLEKVSEYTGWKMEYIPYDSDDSNKNVQEALEDLESGKVDLLGPLLETGSAAYDLAIPEQNYGTVYTTLCALEDSTLREDNASLASPLRVGLWEKASTRNSEVISYLEAENFNYRLFYYETSTEQLQALQDGTVDVISNVSLSPIENTRIIERFAP